MKDTIFSILKYALLVLVILILTGYLSLTDRLPALIPEDVAHQMRHFSQNALAVFTGKERPSEVVKTAAQPGTGKQAAVLSAVNRQPALQAETAVPGQNFLYSIADRLVLGGRLAVMKDFSLINSRKTSEMTGSYRGFVSSLAGSELFLFFLANPGRDDKRFELKSYLEKFLKDNEDAVGFELRDPRGARLLASSKTVISVPDVPLRGDFGMAPLTAGGLNYVVFAKGISVNGRGLGSFYLVYRAEIFRTLVLPDKFGAAVPVLGPGGQLVYGRSNDFDRNQILQLRASVTARALPLVLDFEGRHYRAVYSPIGAGFTAVSLYRTVSAWQMALNLAVILLAIGMTVLLVRLFFLLYKNVWLKSRNEKVKKEEIITGTISEMVKTLKSTAELTAKMAESTREDIGLLERTIDKIQGSGQTAAADSELGQADAAAGNGWEVVNK